MDPLLRVLGSRPDGMPAQQARACLAERLELDESDLADVLPSGLRRRFDERVSWAHDRLKRAGLSDAVHRGFWRLTSAGHEMLAANGSKPLDVESIVSMGLNHTQPLALAPEDAKLSPKERIEAAHGELTESLTLELLDTFARAGPEYFERVVLDVLRAMGYSAPSRAIERTGDGSIDGIVALDRLGLERVYVQAKRGPGSVGRPVIQAFFGALASRRATKGLFITTARINSEATEFARRASDGLTLVDGEHLAQLMIEYEVGVSVERVVKLCRVSTDYLEEP